SGTVRPFLIPPRDRGGRAHSLSGVRVQAEGTPGKVIQGRDVAAAPSTAQRPIDALGAPPTVAAGTFHNNSVRNNPFWEDSARRYLPPARVRECAARAAGTVALQESWSQVPCDLHGHGVTASARRIRRRGTGSTHTGAGTFRR